MAVFLDSLGLNLIYLALLAIGVIYAVLILIGGGPGVGPAHVDMSVDSAEVKLPSLSPVTLASFVTAFGAFGLIATSLFDASARASLLWAIAGGLVVAVIAHFPF